MTTVLLHDATHQPEAKEDAAERYKNMPRLKERWSKSGTPYIQGVPRSIDPRALTLEQMDSLAQRIRLEEITHKLVTDSLELGFASRGRSPSPEPVYDHTSGKRTNTRDVRLRERFALERQHIINDAEFSCPVFRPPPDHRPVSLKKMRKLFIPVDKYPDYNFIGLIIGPRGKTHRELEAETGCRIFIRGKGSARSGRDESSERDEPIHVRVVADTEKQLQIACRRVSQFLIPTDDSKNVHKQKQLMELAVINGTYRGDTRPQYEEKTWERPKVVCEHCGEPSHPSMDCPFRGTDVEAKYKASQQEMTDEYRSYLAEFQGDGEQPSKRQKKEDETETEEAKAKALAEYEALMADL